VVCRRPRRPPLALAAVLLAVATGCSPPSSGGDTAAAGATPASDIPIGPGPRPTYTVEPQPTAGSCHYRHVSGQPLPDRTCTPGALNPDVTQATLAMSPRCDSEC
jgi:hypothetical protein